MVIVTGIFYEIAHPIAQLFIILINYQEIHNMIRFFFLLQIKRNNNKINMQSLKCCKSDYSPIRLTDEKYGKKSWLGKPEQELSNGRKK